MQTIVEKLKALIRTHRWENAFQRAIKNAQSHDVPSIKSIQTLDDYLQSADDLVTWAPSQPKGRNDLYNRVAQFYFFLDQEPVKSLQSPIQPGERPKKLTPLSAWIVEYACTWGSYLDPLDSAKEVETFKSDPTFNWDEYMP